MNPNAISVAEHYDLIIDEIDDPSMPVVSDPFNDTGWLRNWLEQSDGPAFWQAVGDVCGKTVLEVGIGTGRVAKKMLDHGCAHLTGLDISAKTITRARRNLMAYTNIELLHEDIIDYRREAFFDLAYLVWTIFHIENKSRALANIVASLKPGGRMVISLERVGEWLDYGSRQIRLYPVSLEELTVMLKDCNCRVEEPVMVYDVMSQHQTLLAVIISAEKSEE